MPKVTRYFQSMNKAQQLALKKVYDRAPMYATVEDSDKGKRMTYREFRKTANYSSLVGCFMVPWAGMVLGIEDDGYTHS